MNAFTDLLKELRAHKVNHNRTVSSTVQKWADRLENAIKQASAAPEQEAAEPVVIEVHNGCVYMISKPLEPGRHKLYTHPSAEIERLRAENKRLDLALAQADHNYDCDRQQFEQKLAEAQAIMGRVLVKEWLSPNCPLHKRIDAFLSATAQPAEVTEGQKGE